MIPFVLAAHRALGAGPNTCWSPYAVVRALCRLAADARGMTRDELVTALLGDKGADLGELDAVLTRAEEPGAELGVSTTVWADPAVATGDGVRPAPFRAAPETARALINADVAATTRGLVPELVDVLPPDAVSALVVALYLRCGWVEPFDPADTEPRRFRTAEGKKQVPTMRLVSSELGYAATDAWQVVALPAQGAVRAVVLLPYGDLARFEAELTADTLAGLLAAPRRRHLDLRLPAFAVRARTELTGVLESLGVRTAFTADAELGAGLALDTVPHESVLTVDERGIEGAAAVAAIAWMSGATEPPVVVAVDRPFLFAVVHEETGVPYFLARITDPVTP